MNISQYSLLTRLKFSDQLVVDLYSPRKGSDREITYSFSMYGTLEVQQGWAASKPQLITDKASDHMLVGSDYVLVNVCNVCGVPPKVREDKHCRP